MRTTFAALFTLIAANGSSAFAPATFGRAGRSTLLQMAENADSSVFLTSETAKACIDAAGGTPLYAYSLDKLKESADDCLAFPNAYGLTVRYAMKASPNGSILKYFNSRGIHIDASSGFEVRRAISNGIPPENISLSTQELPADFAELVDMGIKVNACSISQLERFGEHFAGTGQKVGVRVNPGVGSGGFSSSTSGFSKTNVGGPASSFGIWHELVEDGTVLSIVEKYGLVVERIHTHIGSGSDPVIWQKVATKSLSFCKIFPTVEALNLGGGYKVGRNPGEPTTDLQEIGGPVADAFRTFAEENGRELKLEIEPGTYLVAMSGALVSSVQDKVFTTGEDGHTFLKLDAGMTDVLRPSLYGAVHPITILPGSGLSADVGAESESVVVVGHCCESGDLMTPEAGEPESLAEKSFRKAEIGDIVIMDGSGAYCAGMSTKNYNSFPEAPEVLVDGNGVAHVIRVRQSLEQIYENECDAPEGLF
uniref:Diaminopimelate decarboxylase n=1 Tax=Asterionellopsis glacialis TaxID=33640 RepID=A0A7S0KX42_9STRA|mmetsp:Transcript_1610/g.2274  ORF Transcript_1610/g.2274 Transcript_1610/m.2274 type:complete len:480 (+) Transcript_1610:142-1581(+)